MKFNLLILSVTMVLLSSCMNSGRTLPAVSGTQFELLIVMNDTAWNAPVGRQVRDLFVQDMPALPQSEPLMNVHQCNQTEFTDVLKPSRNLLIVEIADKYTQTKIKYCRNRRPIYSF